MRSKNNYNFVIIFSLVLFLSIGYAVVNSVSLSVTGTVGAVTEDLAVYFNGTTSISNTSKVTATATNGTQIGMRAYHPLLTTEGWKSLRPEYAETKIDVGKVEPLKVRDKLIGYEGNVSVVSLEQRPEVENYHTYNLSVEGNHNYIADGVVADNAGCTDT